MNHKEKLLQIYNELSVFNIGQVAISEEYQGYIFEIAQNCFARKAVYTVLSTLLVHKILYPSQDIRYHQKDMLGGFSGRTIDNSEATQIHEVIHNIALEHQGKRILSIRTI
jgi:DNA (cytosine-5)-methyltransferase 1